MAGRRKNGTGTVRERKDGRWEGRIIVGYDDDGKAILKSVFASSRAECNKKLKEVQSESYTLTGKLPTQAKSDMPFGEWMDIWYRNYCKPTIRPSTQEVYENNIYRHVIPQIGSIRLNKLSQSDLQDFYTYLKTNGRLKYEDKFGNGLSDRMVRASHAACRMALEKALKEGLITFNPAIGCKLPPKKSKEMQVLTHDEMRRFLIQAKNDEYYEIFLLDLSTGLRRGELMGLQWEDLNFDTGALRIERQVYRVNGELGAHPLKTKASYRTIVLPPAVLRMLQSYREQMKESIWIFPSPWNSNAPRDPDTLYHMMQLILERAECKKIRFHDLRHTFATMSLEHGMDVKTLSATIGHTSSATTLDIYSHITTEMQVKAARLIDQGIGKNDTNVLEKAVKPEPRDQKPFKPNDGKIRKRGTGCIYRINENLWEGSFFPRHANGKRIKHNVYANTREECETLLAEMIVRIKEEIAAEKGTIHEQSM